MHRKYCAQCNTEFQTEKATQKYCSRSCTYLARQGQPAWNKGQGNGWKDKRGYRWVSVTENGKRRQVREHRYVMEQHLARRLEPWEVIHHINGDIADNRLGNLQLISHDEHTIMEHKGTERPYEARQSMRVYANMREEITRLRSINSELLAACEYGKTDEYRSILKDAVSRLRQSSGVDDWLACELERKLNMEEAAIAKAKGAADE